MLESQHFHLVGIKGVGMTALASCLIDMGKTVTGSDVAEDFVTRDMLERLSITITTGFDQPLPEKTEVVIYSGAHGGSRNPQVQQAVKQHLSVYSHAQALGEVANTQLPVAVCGVGGKSTISGMLAFLCEKLRPQSYAVGVGEILGLAKTGQYLPDSRYFIVEADEYVADPSTHDPQHPVYRFSFLRPEIIICANLHFDHPDVYQDLAHTQAVYLSFWQQLRDGGTLIYRSDDANILPVVEQLRQLRPDVRLLSFASSGSADYTLEQTAVTLRYLPGEFNRLNALAAYAASQVMQLPAEQVLSVLSEYRSVRRRFEYLGDFGGIEIWDDYAHHPSELKAAIQALQQWRTGKRLVVAFQPHTYSRTKQLLSEFASSLATNPEVVLLDIFASAREADDPTVSSQLLAEYIQKDDKTVRVCVVSQAEDLADWVKDNLQAGDILLLLGAGDIYHTVDYLA